MITKRRGIRDSNPCFQLGKLVFGHGCSMNVSRAFMGCMTLVLNSPSPIRALLGKRQIFSGYIIRHILAEVLEAWQLFPVHFYVLEKHIIRPDRNPRSLLYPQRNVGYEFLLRDREAC